MPSDRAMSPSPRLAVLGAGAVTVLRHLPAMRAVGGHAVSIFDPSQAAASSAARAFDIPHVASSADEAINDDAAEAVLIASPNSFHREQTEMALDAGRHVLCEKPVALKMSDALAMEQAAERAGRVLQVGFHHRFSSEHLCVKRLIELGVLGDVQAYSGIISEPLDVVPGGLKNYRFDTEQGGGFTLIDVAQHRIDQVRDLLGEVAAVSCEMASVLAGHDKDDSVVLSLRMESGGIGSLNWHRFSRAFASPLMLFGTKAALGCGAMITSPFQSAPVSVYLEGDPSTSLPPEILAWTRPARWWGDIERGWVNIWPPRTDTFREQMLDFFQAVNRRKPPRASGADGFKALEVVQAAYRAFDQQRSIQLPLDPNSHCAPPLW